MTLYGEGLEDGLRDWFFYCYFYIFLNDLSMLLLATL